MNNRNSGVSENEQFNWGDIGIEDSGNSPNNTTTPLDTFNNNPTNTSNNTTTPLDTLDSSYVAKDPAGGVLDNQDSALPEHLEAQPDKTERELQLYGEHEYKSFLSPNRVPSDPIDRRRLELKEEYVSLYVDKYVDMYLKSGMDHEAAMANMRAKYRIQHIKDDDGRNLNLASNHFLKHPHFDLLLQNKLTSMKENGIITQKAIMSALAGMGFTSIYDILDFQYITDPDTGEEEVSNITLKHPNKLHAMQRSAVKSIKLKKDKKGCITSVDVSMHDQMRALEILGDAMGVIGKGAEREKEIESNNYEIIDSYELTEADQEYLDNLKAKKVDPIK